MASKSVARFRLALQETGLEDTVLTLDDSARTAREAALALGCEVGQIVKSLVFRGADEQPLLVLAAGDIRVDEGRLAVSHGVEVSMADAAFVRATTGYAIGGVPPFGHPRLIPTLIDSSLERWETAWAAAGTPHSVFSLPVTELERITGGRVVTVG